jgi:MoaA/NifB/PqqE/SkfB family radical SAM enzyme
MQEPSLKLKEIIYEITDNCYQNCSYCGSKDHINKTKIDGSRINNIVTTIANYPPEEINISGGNPLLVDYTIHESLVTKLKAKGVKCKLIINPFNISIDTDFDIIKLYDWVGISINNRHEVESLPLVMAMEGSIQDIRNKFTVITNFNISNIFDFGLIEKFVIDNDIIWQIQYTMYTEDNYKQAIYANSTSDSYLRQLISNSKANIVLGDNMNPKTKCTAGVHSLGICANGYVIPCLSMVSWMTTEQLNNSYQGNLSITSLQDIWENQFKDYRFKCFNSCKEHCNICKEVNVEPVITHSPIEPITFIKMQYPPIDTSMVMTYAVIPRWQF